MYLQPGRLSCSPGAEQKITAFWTFEITLYEFHLSQLWNFQLQICSIFGITDSKISFLICPVNQFFHFSENLFLSENATLIDVDKVPPDICEDPEDAKLLALAQKSGAPYLITGDKDLLAIKKYTSSKSLSPRQFWETVKKQNET